MINFCKTTAEILFLSCSSLICILNPPSIGLKNREAPINRLLQTGLWARSWTAATWSAALAWRIAFIARRSRLSSQPTMSAVFTSIPTQLMLSLRNIKWIWSSEFYDINTSRPTIFSLFFWRVLSLWMNWDREIIGFDHRNDLPRKEVSSCSPHLSGVTVSTQGISVTLGLVRFHLGEPDSDPPTNKT